MVGPVVVQELLGLSRRRIGFPLAGDVVEFKDAIGWLVVIVRCHAVVDLFSRNEFGPNADGVAALLRQDFPYIVGSCFG